MASSYETTDYAFREEYLPASETPKYPVAFVNQLQATKFIRSLLERRNYQYALIGAFAIYLLGGPKRPTVVEMVTNATTSEVWSLLLFEERLCLPRAELATDIIHLYVETGPEVDDLRVPHVQAVRISIFHAGVGGTPRDFDVITLPPARAPSMPLKFKGLAHKEMWKLLAWRYIHDIDNRGMYDAENICFLLHNFGEDWKTTDADFYNALMKLIIEVEIGS